jgi:hypothetical protein
LYSTNAMVYQKLAELRLRVDSKYYWVVVKNVSYHVDELIIKSKKGGPQFLAK